VIRVQMGLVREKSEWKLLSVGLVLLDLPALAFEWDAAEMESTEKAAIDGLKKIAEAVESYRRTYAHLPETLAKLGIDDYPPALTAEEKRATVRDLLEARSGVYHPAAYETLGMAAKRPERGSHAPGTFWYYNNWDFNALGTIYEHATGTGIYDALDRLIAKPVGMQDYRPEDGVYFPGAASIHRAYPLRMSARDLARFGLLYLNKGAWVGKQIVPADWVRESTRPYSVQPSSGFGYGYLWWTAPPTPGPDGIPEGTFIAWGAGGQHAFIIPAYDLVVVNRVDRDQNLPEPKVSEVKQLLSLTLKAGPFSRQ